MTAPAPVMLRLAALDRWLADRAQGYWAQLQPDALQASFVSDVLPALVPDVIAAQMTAAQIGAQSVAASDPGAAQPDAAFSDQLGLTAPDYAALNVAPDPGAFAGFTGDGRLLGQSLSSGLVQTYTNLQRGVDPSLALASGFDQLDETMTTAVQDSARTASGTAIASSAHWSGYIRVVEPGACDRCVILAGKFYRWNKGFLRHPNCFPAGVTVSGPAVNATTRRWYEGELSIIRTASGQELPATGNHPVLTDRGWVPANLIQEGDYVVRSALGQGAVPIVVPNEQQMPSSIEDLWRPNLMMPLVTMPTAAEDFHGDGTDGQVDVVLADRLLRDRFQSSLSKFSEHEEFAGRTALTQCLVRSASGQKFFHASADTSYGRVSRRSLSLSLDGSHATRFDEVGFRSTAGLHTLLQQSRSDRVTGYSESDTEGEFAFASSVGRSNVGVRQDVFLPRWDAPADSCAVDNRAGYTSRGRDLRHRLSGQVELDRVVENRRVNFCGHVYNLDSVEGWYSANGLIVSNCRCIHQAVSGEYAPPQDPNELFANMTPAEQDRGFTINGAQAIRDGADISQVVNARLGIAEAGTTLQGTTRRAWTSTVQREIAAQQGLPAPRAGRIGQPRLLPEEIYRRANGNRSEALRLLIGNGYLVGDVKELAALYLRLSRSVDLSLIGA